MSRSDAKGTSSNSFNVREALSQYFEIWRQDPKDARLVAIAEQYTKVSSNHPPNYLVANLALIMINGFCGTAYPVNRDILAKMPDLSRKTYDNTTFFDVLKKLASDNFDMLMELATCFEKMNTPYSSLWVAYGDNFNHAAECYVSAWRLVGNNQERRTKVLNGLDKSSKDLPPDEQQPMRLQARKIFLLHTPISSTGLANELCELAEKDKDAKDRIALLIGHRNIFVAYSMATFKLLEATPPPKFDFSHPHRPYNLDEKERQHCTKNLTEAMYYCRELLNCADKNSAEHTKLLSIVGMQLLKWMGPYKSPDSTTALYRSKSGEINALLRTYSPYMVDPDETPHIVKGIFQFKSNLELLDPQFLQDICFPVFFKLLDDLKIRKIDGGNLCFWYDYQMQDNFNPLIKLFGLPQTPEVVKIKIHIKIADLFWQNRHLQQNSAFKTEIFIFESRYRLVLKHLFDEDLALSLAHQQQIVCRSLPGCERPSLRLLVAFLIIYLQTPDEANKANKADDKKADHTANQSTPNDVAEAKLVLCNKDNKAHPAVGQFYKELSESITYSRDCTNLFDLVLVRARKADPVIRKQVEEDFKALGIIDGSIEKTMGKGALERSMSFMPGSTSYDGAIKLGAVKTIPEFKR